MKYRLAVILVTLLALSACAGLPSKQSVYTNPNSESMIGNVARVAIIADVCLMKDVLGDGYWVVQESRSAAEQMLDAAGTYLAGKGYEVSSAQAPFVGAFKSRTQPFRVRATSEGEVAEINPPLFESESLANDPVYKESLLQVIPNIPAVQAPQSSLPAVCCSNAEMKNHLTVIDKNTGGDATLFLIGHGSIVSGGKQFVQGLTTGLLTTALTLGMVSVARYNVSFLDTYAVLVDNATGEVLWSNSMRMKGDGFTDKAYYDAEKWPKNILYYLPSKTGQLRNNEAEPTNNKKPSPM
ncbi:MAG: hypothetical protein EPN25_05580 [Nitrospirae bacterium]|nr:MAG: hypothetical protein EPN25_05580 [Nitrospirota bacterium]